MNDNSPTAPRRLKASERREQAVKLRMSGLTFEQIGNRLQMTRQAAHKSVMKALEENRARITENTEQLTELEIARLDRMQAAIWDAVIKGGYGAIDRVLRIMERRAKLLGLDKEKEENGATNINIHVVHDNDFK